MDFHLEKTQKVSSYSAQLGEGLILTPDGPAWVDIIEQKVIWGKTVYSLNDHIPSVILDCDHSHLLIGTNRGLYTFSRDGSLIPFCTFSDFNTSKFRLNDGCRLSDGSYIVGSMSQKDPQFEMGKIYRFFNDGQCIEYDWSIHIPNSFIQVDNLKLLITDSYTKTVHIVDIADYNLAATPWYQEHSIATPDGGCLLPNGTICFAMWDGGCLKVLDKNSRWLYDIKLPALRPTNCCYDVENQGLYVTSAKHDLDPNDLLRYPESGRCFFLKHNLA